MNLKRVSSNVNGMFGAAASCRLRQSVRGDWRVGREVGDGGLEASVEDGVQFSETGSARLPTLILRGSELALISSASFATTCSMSGISFNRRTSSVKPTSCVRPSLVIENS